MVFKGLISISLFLFSLLTHPTDCTVSNISLLLPFYKLIVTPYTQFLSPLFLSSTFYSFQTLTVHEKNLPGKHGGLFFDLVD